MWRYDVQRVARPYLGKENHPNFVGAAEHVVLTLMNPYYKSGQNVTKNNFLHL